MKQLWNKLNRNRAGFSLGEMLATTLILLMVTGIVAAGLPAAQRAYYKVVDAANAEVLLSTTMSAIRGELTTAEDVTVSGSEIEYRSNGVNLKSKLYNGNDNAGIQLQDPRMNTGNKERPLISKATQPNGLYAVLTPKTLSDGIITMKIAVYDKDGKELSKVDNFAIRLLNS